MKTVKTFTKLVAVAALALLSTFSALGQDMAPIIATFSLPTTNFAGSASSNYTLLPTYSGQTVTLKPHNGFAIVATVGSTNGTTAASPVGFKFDLSADGINWTTTTPLTNAVTLNGTNIITGYTLFPYTVADHMRYIRLANIVNANTNIINLISVNLSYFNKPI